jgi:transcriptional regulator with XRE-family HTH domain
MKRPRKRVDCQYCKGTGNRLNGAYLRWLRGVRDLTLRDVAKRLGISHGWLADYEQHNRGRLVPKGDEARFLRALRRR